MVDAAPDAGQQLWLILVTGWTGAGKSSIADRLGEEMGATVVSFDWMMSALRAIPEVWDQVEMPIEKQRRVGWNLLSRVAEQQLRRGSSCVLDLVAREEPRHEFEELAHRYGARFAVLECVCSDEATHRSRVEGRERGIAGWYELDWDGVAAGRLAYAPLAEPKLVLDSVLPIGENLDVARSWLRSLTRAF